MNVACRLCGVGVVCLAAAMPMARGQDEALEKAINSAIERGLNYLKKNLQDDGGFKTFDYRAGTTALVGWALLESGVPKDDAKVRKAAAFVREAVGFGVGDKPGPDHPYSISLAIFFLDRLGEPQDRPLIQWLGVRLLRGQTRFAGWHYAVPGVDDAEKQRLRQFLARGRAGATKKEESPEAKPDPQQVPAELLQELRRGGPPQVDVVGDNSNTQFAMMALWAARRHGLPVDRALQQVEARFRKTQLDGGGWSYSAIKGFGGGDFGPRPSMTAAGVLAIALSQGTVGKEKIKELLKDPAVKKGLEALGKVVDGSDRMEMGPGTDLYFYWSLERMAVVYDLKTVGGTEWYPWGARHVLACQSNEGHFAGSSYYPVNEPVDTCFALLFLKRANVAFDLSPNLKAVVKQPAPKKKDEPLIFDPGFVPKKDKSKKSSFRQAAPRDSGLTRLETWGPDKIIHRFHRSHRFGKQTVDVSWALASNLWNL
jgi:hypothetical protein